MKKIVIFRTLHILDQNGMVKEKVQQYASLMDNGEYSEFEPIDNEIVVIPAEVPVLN